MRAWKKAYTRPGAPTFALRKLRVAVKPGQREAGILIAGQVVAPCRLGRNGITQDKREGDGATPRGTYRLVSLLYRADRMPRPLTRLPCRAIRPDDGWCDDPVSPRYNQPIGLPARERHEILTRADRLYDLVVVIAHNFSPIRRGRGSAVFMHVAAVNGTPTAGCVALDPAALRRVLTRVGRDTRLTIA